MSPKISRLPQQEFLSRGFMAVRTPYFSLKIKKNAIKKARIGVVVGKAVHKSAVKRNFFKRQAKEVLGKSVAAGNDLLIIFSPAANKLTKKQLQEVLIKSATHL
jgi:ribonuclease P protein component